jgi:hypothetical protein
MPMSQIHALIKSYKNSTVMSMNTTPFVFDGKRYTIGGEQHEDAYE